MIQIIVVILSLIILAFTVKFALKGSSTPVVTQPYSMTVEVVDENDKTLAQGVLNDKTSDDLLDTIEDLIDKKKGFLYLDNEEYDLTKEEDREEINEILDKLYAQEVI